LAITTSYFCARICACFTNGNKINQERGYQPRKIPQLILENNLFGLDIDDRAAQLAGFALMMLARADDKRIFSRDVQLNVMAMQSGSLGGGGLGFGGEVSGGGQLIEIFEDAKTLGSLIAIPELFAKRLADIRQQIEALAQAGDIFSQHEALILLPLVKQAQILRLFIVER
jgi:type II restriction/modification system DNA methylase subunit YeeA